MICDLCGRHFNTHSPDEVCDICLYYLVYTNDPIEEIKNKKDKYFNKAGLQAIYRKTHYWEWKIKSNDNSTSEVRKRIY